MSPNVCVFLPGGTVQGEANPNNESNLLASGTWTNQGYTVTGTNETGETLDFVTNDVDTIDNEKFIRLRIGQ